jgi:long-chain acyl-CoA synthetase
MVLLPHALIEAAARSPAAVAIKRDQHEVRYAELLVGAGKLARALRDTGLQAGDRVGLLLDAGSDFALCTYAIWFADGVVLNLNVAARAEELAASIHHAGCTVVVVDAEQVTAPKLLSLLGPDVKVIVRGAARLDIVAAPDLDDILRGPAEPITFTARPEALASLLYTSGSTGAPKGVMLSHGNLAANAASIVDYLQLTSGDSIACVLPFHYSYGASILHTHLSVGARIVVEPNLVFPHRVVEAMARERVTGFAGVPSTFTLLLSRVQLARYDLNSLRYVTQAGGAMSPALAERVRAAFPHSRLFVMYGQTEATARLTYLPPDVGHPEAGCVGRAVRDVEIEIRDADLHKQPCGESGEIWARGPNVMLGYWKDPAATARVLRGGWLRTGDQGRLDKNGHLHIEGRRSDIIKVGAHRVHPIDIEQTIEELAEVAEVAAVGEDDALLGQVVKVFIVTIPDAKLDVETIKAHTRARLAAYKVPRSIEFVASLPRTASGKLRRQMLQSPPSTDPIHTP